MATKRDLVEAHAFSRRRLVTAFVSGAPGGREVEPSRPGGMIIGGIALSVLLLAGAAIAGIFSGRPPEGWLDRGLVVAGDRGTAYVILKGGDDPVLHPTTYLNAKLILGADVTPRTVSMKYIAQQRIGDDLGILGAPSDLPDTDHLIADGWSACTADGHGVRTAISRTPQVREVTDTAFVLTTGRPGGPGPYWLVAEASSRLGPATETFRMRLPSDRTSRGTLLSSLNLGAAGDATRVPEAWLNLFPEAPALARAQFGVTRSGAVRYSGVSGLDGSGARYGDLVAAGGKTYLLADDAPYELDVFAARVYQATTGRMPVQVEQLRAAFGSPGYPAQWPGSDLTAARDEICAVLMPQPDDQSPQVRMAIEPTTAVSARDIPADRRDAAVDPGYAAFVYSAGFGSTEGGTPYVIDAKGDAYQLEGPGVVANLGYGSYPARMIPDSWLGLFGKGVVLSVAAAGAPPGSTVVDEDG